MVEYVRILLGGENIMRSEFTVTGGSLGWYDSLGFTENILETSVSEEDIEVEVEDLVESKPEQENEVAVDNSVFNQFLIGISSDVLQKYFVNSLIDDLDLPTDVVEINTVKDLPKLYRFTKRDIFDKKSIVKVLLTGRVIKPILDSLIKLRLKDKITILYVENIETAGFLERYLRNTCDSETRIQRLPITDDYADKKKILTGLFRKWRVGTSDKEVSQLLLKATIANIDDLDRIKTALLSAKEGKIPLDLDFLTELFDGVDFYNLEEFFSRVIRCNTFKTQVKILHHFATYKQYSPEWLMDKLKDYVLTLNYFYIAYAKGVISHPLDAHELESRLKVSDMPNPEILTTISAYKQQDYLDFVLDVPYNYISDVTKIVFDKTYQKPLKQDLYRVLHEINNLKYKYISDPKQREKGFINTRRLSIMKRKAFERSKMTRR